MSGILRPLGWCAGPLVLTGLLFASGVRAAPLNLTLLDAPDIFAGFIDVQFDAQTTMLIASGFASTIDDDGFGPAENITAGSFELSALIDSGGQLLSGSLQIGGIVSALGFNSGTLLMASLTAIGFPNAGGDPLEFLFEVQGGDAAPLYGNVGGVILSFTGFEGSFTADWDNLINGAAGTGSAVADVAPVPQIPLPGALWLMAPAVLGLAGLRGRPGAANG